MKNKDTFSFFISEFFRNLIYGLYFYIAVVVFFFSYGVYVFLGAEKVYEVSSLIKIDPSSKIDSELNIQSFSQSNYSVLLDEEIELYLSNTNLIEMVKRHNLNVFIDTQKIVPPDSKPIQFSNVNVMLEESENFRSYFFVKTENGYEILDSDKALISKNKFDEFYAIDGLEFLVSRIDSDIGTVHEVTFAKIESVKNYLRNYYDLRKTVLSRNFLFGGSLFNVRAYDSDIDRATFLINELNEIYVESDIKSESTRASRSLDFVGSQLKLVNSKLIASQKLLNDFRVSSNNIDIEIETASKLQELTTIDKEIGQLELQIADLSTRYLNSTVLESLQVQIDVLKNKRNALQENLNDLPNEQQVFINLAREVELNQAILEKLTEKSMELSIEEASTIGKIRIVDSAHKKFQVSPTIASTVFLYSILGLVIVLSYIAVRARFFSVYNSPSQLATYFNYPLAGVIQKDENILENFNTEELNSFVTNININLKDESKCNKLIVTSSLAGAGKSTIAYLMAKNLSARGKRVLLIDCDYKRGKLHETISNSFSRTKVQDFIRDDERNFKDLKSEDNLYFLPRIAGGSKGSLSTFESKQFSNFINASESFFDYIVFDTPPVLLISDALVLASFTDLAIVVNRHESTRVLDSIKTVDELSKTGLDNIMVAYNAFSKSFGTYYGYDNYYGYKYYGTKNYEYNYADDNEK
jgi:tyrosine-protein kinase Etk/Wzc